MKQDYLLSDIKMEKEFENSMQNLSKIVLNFFLI